MQAPTKLGISIVIGTAIWLSFLFIHYVTLPWHIEEMRQKSESFRKTYDTATNLFAIFIGGLVAYLLYHA